MESDESDGTFPPWVSLEYSQMLKVAAPSTVIFSSLSSASVNSLGGLLEQRGATKEQYRAETDKVLDLMKKDGVPLERVCLLDPKATEVIAPEDAKEFDWFL
jgi:ribosome biogenesis SPOUT family RNA methylase Rps3